jgi:hypothetical protein
VFLIDFDDNSGFFIYGEDGKLQEQSKPILDKNDWILNGIRIFEH